MSSLYQRVLITGASGFVGRHLTPFIAAHGYTVLAAVRSRQEDVAGVMQMQMPDLRHSDPDWTLLLRGVDAIVHLAGAAHRDLSEQEADRINHLATAKLANAAANADVGRFVLVSSIAAQSGASADHALTEDRSPVPQNAYGRSKLAAEEAVRASGVPFVILRPVVIAGINAKGNFGAMEQLARMPLPLPVGGLRSRRSILTVESFNTAVLISLENAAALGQTFIVSDEPALAVSEIFKLIRLREGRSPNLFYVPEKLIQLALRAIGKGSLWERLGGSLIAESGKLRSIGWSPGRLDISRDQT